MIENFHFLRPVWLLALLPVALLGWRLWRRSDSTTGWRGLIHPELLAHLLETAPPASRWPRLALLAAWLLGVLALAGPTWERLPQPVYRDQQAQVLMLDLSPSMLAADLKPSRLVHARHRLIDLVKAREEGLTGLVVYSGDAHVVTPLSHDRRTLLALAPTLSPEIMPAFGSRVEAAVEQALTLLERGGQRQGDLVLITDGIAPEALTTLRDRLGGSPYRLSILGVGTAAGAPVPLADGRLARDSDGELLLARLNRDELAALARDTGGLYRDLAPDGSGVEALVQYLQRPIAGADTTGAVQEERRFDLWSEAGPWLVLLLLPVAALAHRRGWLLLVLLVPLSMPEPAHALEWRDLWLTPDQQGAKALARDEPEAAAELFEDPRRQGQALYRSGDYARAAERFAAAAKAFPSGDTHYNLGNALARAGKLEEALAAYDQALALDPDLNDVRHNRGLVEELLKQQQEQESSEGEDGQEQDSPQSEEAGGQPDAGQGEGAGGSEGENPSEDSPGDGSQEQDPGAASPPPQTEEGKTGEGESQQPPDGEGAGSAEPESESADEQQQEGAPAEPSPAPREESAGAGSPVTQGGGEEQDPVMERWLRQLPEDPGGLLRRKFDYEYRQRRAQGAASHEEPRW